LLAEYEGRVNFLTVYIKEAHPQDLWPLGQHVSVMNHTCIEDRIEVAKRFIAENEWKLETVVDSMENGFMDTFKSHPERFYGIVDCKLGFKAFPVDAYYLVSDIQEWLSKHFENISR